MYLSCVIEIRVCPRWSAPILADRPSSSIKVAIDLRKLWVVDPGTPRSSRTSAQLGLKWTDLDEPAATLTITGKVTRRQASAG